jgi:soluble lytic murein transglycosylase-like protein
MKAQESPYADIIAHAADEYNVPQDWIAAFISQESSWNSNAYAPGEESYGLMQVRVVTAHGLGWTGDPKELLDPDLNIHLGAKLLGQLRQSYGDDLTRIASAYNSGHPDYYRTNPQVANYVYSLTQKYDEITGGTTA